MSLFSWLGNLIHKGEHAVAQAARPAVQTVRRDVQQAGQGAQRAVNVITHPAPPRLNLPHPDIHPIVQAAHDIVHAAQYGPAGIAGYGLQQGAHNIQRVENVIVHSKPAQNIAKVKIPVAGNIGNATRALVGEGILDPAVRAAQTGGGALQGQKIKNPRQFASDAAQTALNVGTGGAGADVLKVGLKQGVKQGAKVGAKIGAAQGGVQSYRDKANLKQTAVNVAGGAVTGAALGAATPVAGKAVKVVAKEVKAGFPLAKNQRGSVGSGPEFLKHYTPSKNVTADEAFALKYLTENHDKAKADYVKRIQKEFGIKGDHVVAGDEVKHIIPNFGPDKSGAYHEPASAFAKQHYEDILKRPDTMNKPVLITAGGTGAGKTTGLKARGNLDEAAAIVDTNLTDLKGAKNRINTARATGRPVEIHGVYRDPIAAFKGVINRGKSTGRIVIPETHADTHAGSHQTLQQIPKEYANDPMVIQHLTHNLENGKHKPLTVDELSKLGYTKEEIVKKAHGILDEAKANSQITEAEHKAYVSGGVQGMEREISRQVPQGTREGDAPIQGNRFTQGVKASPEVSSEVQQAVSGQHTVRNTAQLSEDANAAIDHYGLDKATQATHDALSVKSGKISDEDVAHAITVAKRNDADGNFDQATSIYDALSEHLVHAGQTIQAASLLMRRSPEGLLMHGRKALKKAGVELTPELSQALKVAKDKVASLPEGSKERDYAVAEFQKLVDRSLPSNVGDKTLSIWKAGLLSGAKTQGGNALSNSTFGVLKKISDIPATAIDAATSLVTGKRTKTLTARGIASGAKEGVGSGYNTMKTGIDVRNIGEDKYQHREINFKNPLLRKYVNGVFRSMSAADQPFYYAALRNNLEDIARAEAKNVGGDASFVKSFIENPPTGAFQTATDAAEKAVLGQDSPLSRAVTGAVQKLGLPGRVLVPFTKVPTNFLERTLDFTPVGAIKTAVSQIKNGKFDQRALSEALGEATTGTGVIYLGTQLAQEGLLSGDFPNDPKEQARWKAEGITPNSIRVGDHWYSLNYLGPVGLLFGAGKNMVQATSEGNNQVAQAIAGLGKGLTGQSFLQGFSGFANALQDPGRYGANLVQNQGASVIPSFINDIANLSDPMQRQATGVAEAIKARVPGLRQGLEVKQDAFGNPLDQAGGQLGQVNPFKPSKVRSTDVTNEIDRLKGTGKDNFVFPTTDKSLTVGKNTIKLSGKEQTAWNKQVGQQTQTTWDAIIKTPEYQNLPDDKKASALSSAAKDINAVEKVKYLQSLGEPQNDNMRAAYDSLTKTQKKIIAGELSYDPNAYIKGQEPKAKKVRIARGKRTKGPRVAKGKKGRRVAIAKPPKLNLKPVHIKVGKSKVSNPKVAKAHYAKAKNIATTSKKVTLTV